jgi:hypothetical protein
VNSRSPLTKKQRYAEDAEYRERLRGRCRAWWAAHRDEINARRREKRRSSGVSSYTPRKKQRYAEDAEYRAGVRAYNRAWVAAHRDEIVTRQVRRCSGAISGSDTSATTRACCGRRSLISRPSTAAGTVPLRADRRRRKSLKFHSMCSFGNGQR